jgi:Uma2 family endonuclease
MAAPVFPPLLRDGDRLTRDEFMRRWEQMPDLHFAELIDGIVYMPSPVSRVHGVFHSRSNYWLVSYIAATPGCEAADAVTWLMSEDSAPQPDLSLRIESAFGGQSRIEGEYPAGAPELVVEISYTTSAKDMGAKLRLYERSGVLEYVTLRPRKQQIIWRELIEGKYREIAPDEDGLLRSRIFPGLWLNPAALWAGDVQALAATLQQGIATSEHGEFVERLARAKR